MGRIWKILFEGDKPGPADDFELKFRDTKDIFGKEVPAFKREFFDKIIEAIKNNDNYYVWENIKSITPPKDAQIELTLYTIDNYFIILGIDQDDLRYGILMLLTEDAVIVRGIWPDGLVDAIKKDHEFLDGVLFGVLGRPDLWKEVVVVYAKQEQK